MPATAITPSIGVTIGQQMRLYHAFVTTAPAVLDAPLTMTLYVASLADVCGLAADPISVNTSQANSRARLVLVDSTGLSYWSARDLVLAGDLPSVRMPCPRARDGRSMRRIMIDRRDLDAFIERFKEREEAAATLSERCTT